MDRLRPVLRQASTSSRSLPRPSLSPAPLSTPSPGKGKAVRRYPLRKRFLFESYRHLFRSNEVVLLFRHDTLTPQEWQAVRAGLVKLSKAPAGAAGDVKEGRHAVKVEVLRTGLLPPVLNSLPPTTLPPSSRSLLQPHLTGSLCLLSQPVFSPSILSKSLDLLAKHGEMPSAAQKAALATRKKSDPTTKIDRLPFVFGFISQRAFPSATELAEVKKLPELETLRAQIVGLVGMVGARVVGTIREGAGGKVVRTVEGYRAGLEEGQKSKEATPEPTK